MAIIKNIVPAVLVFLAVGCATPTEKARQTQIITDPENARIEVNGEYLGNSPVTVKLRQRGCKIVGEVVIRATPFEAELRPQTKRLIGPVVPLTGGADAVPAKLFFDLRRDVNTTAAPRAPAEAASVTQSEAEARLKVTRLCQEGDRLRLQFFDAKIETLQRQDVNGDQAARLAELKELRTGEIRLQRDLDTFTKYVLAGKPFAVTAEEIQASMADSQRRAAYFAAGFSELQEQRQRSAIGQAEFDQQSAALNRLQTHDLFLQQVLTGFAQEKIAYEQWLANQQRNLEAAAAGNTAAQSKPGNLWEQSGNNTFDRLLHWAIMAKLLQNQNRR